MKFKWGSWFEFELAAFWVYVRFGQRDLFWSLDNKS